MELHSRTTTIIENMTLDQAEWRMVSYWQTEREDFVALNQMFSSVVNVRTLLVIERITETKVTRVYNITHDERPETASLGEIMLVASDANTINITVHGPLDASNIVKAAFGHVLPVKLGRSLEWTEERLLELGGDFVRSGEKYYTQYVKKYDYGKFGKLDRNRVSQGHRLWMQRNAEK